MKQAGVSGTRQLISERSGLLGRDVEPEDFDRNQAVAGRLVGAEYRPERPNANLMQDPEWSECRGWSECCRIVSGHSGEGPKKCNTDRTILLASSQLSGGVPRPLTQRDLP